MAMASLPKVVRRAGSPALVLRDGPVTRAPELCRGHPNARSATPAHKDDGRGFNFKSRPVIFLIFLDFLTIYRLVVPAPILPMIRPITKKSTAPPSAIIR